MSNKHHPAAFNGIAGGSFAPRSAGAINAQRNDPYGLSDAGTRHNQRYIVAATSGGKSAPPPAPM